MKDLKKEMLYEAQEFCEKQGKSEDFMIAFMGDYADVDHDTVMDYLTDNRE